eukprot:358837-Chlamydomonas_euryale.AAC.1
MPLSCRTAATHRADSSSAMTAVKRRPVPATPPAASARTRPAATDVDTSSPVLCSSDASDGAATPRTCSATSRMSWPSTDRSSNGSEAAHAGEAGVNADDADAAAVPPGAGVAAAPGDVASPAGAAAGGGGAADAPVALSLSARQSSIHAWYRASICSSSLAVLSASGSRKDCGLAACSRHSSSVALSGSATPPGPGAASGARPPAADAFAAASSSRPATSW